MKILETILSFIWKYKWQSLAIILLTSLFFLYKSSEKKSSEIKRLSGNQEALFDSIKTYKTKDGQTVAIIQRLELSNNEFKNFEKDLNDQIKKLNVKLKNVQSVTELGTQTIINTQTQVKDSIRVEYKDSIIIKDTLKCFDYKTPWVIQKGCLSKDGVSMKTQIRDTLDIILYKIPKKFLFFNYGIKKLEVKATNRNPDAQIISGKFIDFKSIKTYK